MRSAVVTGASSGIGRACALLLDREGFAVFAGVRRPEDGEALAAAASRRLTPVPLDVTRPESLEAARERVAAALGDAGLGGLVNNAGISVPAVLEFLDLDELRRQLEVNLVGALAATRTFLPLLRAGGGRIVHIGSQGGYNAAPFLGPYAASKFALEAVTDALRRELRPWAIEVSIVEPGSVATPIWEKGIATGAELRARLPEHARALYGEALDRITAYAQRAARRGIPPERVARAVHHALTAPRPRTRYRVGLDAKLVRLLTRVLPDRAMDALVARLVGLPGRSAPPRP
jgi:NAD(P)-dependent dehydrogenase (short-subunit alcohol dehydrogenase family)